MIRIFYPAIHAPASYPVRRSNSPHLFYACLTSNTFNGSIHNLRIWKGPNNAGLPKHTVKEDQIINRHS